MRRQGLLFGRVIHGDGQGRAIGYPTANIEDTYFKTNPQTRGVFASRTWVSGKQYDSVSVIGVPDNRDKAKIETHLLDTKLQLYGKQIAVELIKKIRPLRWYNRTDALLTRIADDVIEAKRTIHQHEVEEENKIRSIRIATRELESGMRHIKDVVRVGRSELEVRDRLLRVFKNRQPSFPFIVAAGSSGAFMHHAPTRRKIRLGDSVVVDLGISVNGFCSDLSRTYSMGQPSPLLRRRYVEVLRAQARGIKEIRPHMWAKEIDQVVRGSLRNAKLDRSFLHTTGHGVGRKIHELPSIGQRSVDRLLPGVVITIEPGIYFHDWGGIRIEDMVLITTSGTENLTQRIPSDLRSIIL